MINKRHLEKESFGRRFIDAFSDFFSFSSKELICTAFFAASLTFLSTFALVSQELAQPPSLTDLPMIIEHFGFPFEGLRKIHNFDEAEIPVAPYSKRFMNVTVEYISVEIEWLGVMMDFLVYAVPLIVIVRVIARVKDEIDDRRYDKK